jgi:hypothetical protein
VVRYGIPLLDELRAIRYARKILEPFVSISPKLALTARALEERGQEILASEEFHSAVGDAYNFPCANLQNADFRNDRTGETKAMLTCGVESCHLAGKPVDSDAEMPECEQYRVPAEQLNNLMLR